MELEIDINNPTPVYQQIIDQVMAGLLSIALVGGDPLPTIRQLANDLGLNPNTVAKAYKQLESQRIIQTARRAGTFVHEDAYQNCISANHQGAQSQLGNLIVTFRNRGLSDNDIAGLLKAKIKQLKA